jgi:hypothetical protein
LYGESLRGKHWVEKTERRPEVDWTERIKEPVDEHYAEAERVVLAVDNLNTHTPASLYEVFDLVEAKRLARKLEIRCTTKHAS